MGIKGINCVKITHNDHRQWKQWQLENPKNRTKCSND